MGKPNNISTSLITIAKARGYDPCEIPGRGSMDRYNSLDVQPGTVSPSVIPDTAGDSNPSQPAADSRGGGSHTTGADPYKGMPGAK